ncbi:copper resistance CopC family protein [Mesobacillus foraminis]|uniref:copper resistance CopC family protein n=1 Tax=Mesobacillus foraminis TaxID=279826 RepID=UPI000EF4A7B5|nr:copper resistance CopC family protein [Mesobacillus foraminis]
MRKLIIIAFLFYIILPAMLAHAHTGLEISNPAEGEVILQKLEEVVLTYETEIESLSTMELVNGQQTKIPLNNLTVEGNTMKANLGQELENGAYSINWKIVGKDGHPIEGKVNFQIQLEEGTVADEMEEDSKQAADEPEKQDEPQDVRAEDEEGNLFQILIIGLAIVLAVSFLVLRKKK